MPRPELPGSTPPRSAMDRLRLRLIGDPGSGNFRQIRAYVVALVLTALTLGFRLALDPVLDSQPALVLFTLPIMLSAYIGGLRAGLVATAASCIAAAYFLLPPLLTFNVALPTTRWQLGFLLLAGVVISIVNEGLHRARRRAETAGEEQRTAAAASVESEARYRRLFEAAPEGIVIADGESNYIDANPAACNMFGYTHEAFVALHARDIVVPEENMYVAPALDTIKTTGTYAREWRFRRADGTEFDAEVEATTLPDGNLLGMIRDVTERKRADARIARLNRLYAVQSAINALIVRAHERSFLFEGACRIAVEKGGIPLAWIALLRDGRPEVPLAAWVGGTAPYRAQIEAMFHERAPLGPEIETLLAEARPLVVNDVAGDPRLPRNGAAFSAGLKSLVVLPLLVARAPVALFSLGSDQPNAFDADEMQLLQEMADDISFALDHLQKAEKLDYLAYYDELTGLANRPLLLERLAQNLRGGAGSLQRTALVIVDIERFKNLNDALGHAQADHLLTQVADWLERQAGDRSRVARIGPDRFALVLPEFVQDAEAGRFLERIAEGFLRHPFRVGDSDYRIAAKFGVALSPEDGADAETLFRHAEAALKKAKTGGERYLFYTQQMTAAMSGRLALETRLRHAVDNGEFVLHYQPKVDLGSGRVVGAEALIRWNDPQGGLVPPGMFIPVLEETGLIDEAGRWALRQAIADYARWRGNGHGAPRIAVNVSPLQLRDRGFVGAIRAAIAAVADGAAGLELEITESMIMEDVAYSISSLQALREMGITLAIDDFGTGFSSLGSLAKLPVHTLKIDRSFIGEIDVSSKGLALVTTMIGLAHSLKLKVVAEGVETEQQATLLREAECEEMQGFLFSRPLPRDAFEQRFLAGG